MDDTSGPVPGISSWPAGQGSAEPGSAASPPGDVRTGEGRHRERQRRRKAYVPSWWRIRNGLGVRNWELIVIVFVALVAGVAATLGSSILGVR